MKTPDYKTLAHHNAVLRDAIYTLLNVEAAAKMGAHLAKPLAGLDVEFHFNKARDALAFCQSSERKTP